jgi:hypothetical protein
VRDPQLILDGADYASPPQQAVMSSQQTEQPGVAQCRRTPHRLKSAQDRIAPARVSSSMYQLNPHRTASVPSSGGRVVNASTTSTAGLHRPQREHRVDAVDSGPEATHRVLRSRELGWRHAAAV